ncbi:MAG: M67 family metallopeptidase [Gammaproteobacteria bacterium]|nr:M67 family metallopeptidase [Gammaproteobacteria bacterium]
MSEVALPRGVVNRLLAQAQQSPEAEVCGLIGARDGVPVHVYPVANAAADPARVFVMAPDAQIDAMRRMRECGETLFAIYHSHPHAPAAPSARDLAEAAYPDALYLIISLDTRGVLDMRGFRLHGSQVETVALSLV